MTAGVSVTSGNAMLDSLGAVYVQMHTGDPGANGTSNVAMLASRMPSGLGAAVGGVRTLAAPIDWPVAWGGADQIVTHISAWNAVSGGVFVFSAALVTHATFTAGIIPRLTLLSISIPSLAAD